MRCSYRGVLRHVNGALSDRVLVPRIAEGDIEAWCAGYYVAIAADMAAWAPLLIALPKMLSSILLYGTSDGEEVINKKELIDQERGAAVDSLVESTREIRAYWLAQRRQALNRGEVPGIMPSRRPAAATNHRRT